MTEQTATSKCIKLSNGSEMWLLDGQLHRIDGPAVYRPRTNFRSFYLHGQLYSFEAWINIVTEQITPYQKTVFLLKYGDQKDDR
jgi:hypothetical protein